MKLNVNAINFDTAERLEKYIEKKIGEEKAERGAWSVES